MSKDEKLLIEQIDRFLLGLRMDDTFGEALFKEIYGYFNNHMEEYKSSGNFPARLVASLFFLIDQLAGGSRFWDEETCIKAEDAEIALQELFAELEEPENN